MTDDEGSSMPDDDTEALVHLRRALELADPQPAYLRAAALAAYSHHPLDADLAELATDSALAEQLGLRLELPRSPVRTLDFRHADFAVNIEAEPDGALLRLLVHTNPPDVHTLRIRRLDISHAVHPAVEGPTSLAVSPGPFSLLCLRRGSRAVATSWTLL